MQPISKPHGKNITPKTVKMLNNKIYLTYNNIYYIIYMINSIRYMIIYIVIPRENLGALITPTWGQLQKV